MPIGVAGNLTHTQTGVRCCRTFRTVRMSISVPVPMYVRYVTAAPPDPYTPVRTPWEYVPAQQGGFPAICPKGGVGAAGVGGSHAPPGRPTPNSVAITPREASWGGGRLVCRPGDSQQSNTTLVRGLVAAASQGVVPSVTYPWGRTQG